AAGDILVTNGTAGTISGSGANYTFNVTPAGQGSVSVSILANVAHDAAGNGNSVSNTFSISYDSQLPTTIISSTATGSTNSAPIPVTITFSKSVTGFIQNDLTVTNGTITNFTGSGTTYTLNINPSGQGLVTVSVAAGVAQDAAGNSNSAASPFSITYDTQAPSVIISSAAINPTKSSPIPVTITFNESVSGFIASDISVINGTIGNFTGSGATYTLNITPSGQGLITVNVAAGVAQDAAGNGNTAASPYSITYDSQAPTVTISSTASNPTNQNLIPFTITFSEVVTGFVAGNVVVNNGTISNFTGSGKTYTMNITPTAQGFITVNIASGVAMDAAGNGNTIAVPYSLLFDGQLPVTTISSTASYPTNLAVIPVTVTFSKSVTGFTLDDISVTNGTPGNFSGSGTTYTFGITPAGQGLITVNIAAGVAQDIAGNDNTAASTFSIVYDSQAPTVAISSKASNPTNTSPIPITITFSEAVTGFTLSDISVTNGTAANFTGSGTTYTLNITPTAQGTVIINVAASVASDAAGNGNTVSNTFSLLYDSQFPAVTISSTASNPTNISPIPVTISFSKSVTGFVQNDITVTNGTVGNFSGSGTTYTMNITPSGQGLVSINVAAGVAHDAAENDNTAASPYSLTFDNILPTVAISSSISNPTNTGLIPVSVTFSEPVTGFILNDITVTNGTAGNFSGSGTTYTMGITPSGQGLVSINVAAGVVHDAAGNSNTAASTFNFTYDNLSPSVNISSTASNPTKTSPIPVSILFSEVVTGFTSGDVSVTNGTLISFSGNGASYTMNITPSAQGLVTIAVAGGVAQDLAGNNNTAGNAFSVMYDSQSPIPTITSTTANPTNLSVIPVTISFNEVVSGLTLSDITVTNGTANNFSGSGSTYTLNVSPTTVGTVSVNIATGVASDAAGNGNTAGSFSITFNNQSPLVTISSTAVNPTSISPIPVTVTFSKPVTGFVSSDVSTTNGTVGNFSGNGTTYTMSITPSSQGLVTVNIAAGVVHDVTGNANTASGVFSITYDNQPPSTTISSTVSGITNISPVPVTISFSKVVTGFTLSDVTVINGTANGFSGSGTTYTLNLIPTGQGLVTLSVPARVAQDGAGNGNTAAVPYSYTYDSQAPTVNLTYNHPNDTIKSGDIITMTAVFADANGISETPIPSVTIGNLVSGAAMQKSSNLVWTYQWTVPSAINSSIAISIAASDLAGNAVTGGTNIVTFIIDNISPTVSFSSIIGRSSIHVTDLITIDFSKPIKKTVTNLADAIIFREGSKNGSDVPFTAQGNSLQIKISATMKCNTAYYLAVKSGSFIDNARNPVALSEILFNTDPLPEKPLLSAVSSGISVNGLCPGDALICSNYDENLLYLLKKDGITVSDNYTNQYQVDKNSAGKYSLTVKNSSTTCQNTSDTMIVNMHTTNLPVLFEKKKEGVISILVVDNTSRAFKNYTWTLADGSALPSDVPSNEQFLVLTGANLNGKYIVTAIDTNGCKTVSNTMSATVKAAQTSVYPSITSDAFKIDFIYPDDGKVNVRIMNSNGLMMKEFNYVKSGSYSSFDVSMGSVPNGIYWVEIRMNDFRVVKRIIIQK
ncbi:MAG: Ig-like domain-containing protein, partial [Bacteroidota bacterium]|nr:Ig-like domain-containing protein [Bacteroidota bacterium]